MIIALEGPRAVGKTTLTTMINKINVGIHIHEGYYIKNTPKIITSEMEFYENQRKYIDQKIEQYIAMNRNENHLVTRGIEDILQYTLNYPLIYGFKWDVIKHMKNEIDVMKQFKSDKILYLHASKKVLLARNSNDQIRTRDNFEEWIERWTEKLRCSFVEYSYTYYLDTDTISPEEVLYYTMKIFNEEII